MGDQFWHPQGVQVKAPNSRSIISPPSNGPLSRASGPGIVYVGGVNGLPLPQNPMEKVEGEAPHLFQWVLRQEGAVKTRKIFRKHH